VLAPIDDIEFSDCIFDAPDFDSLVWRVPDHRQALMGSIGAYHVYFRGCRMDNIGLAVRDRYYGLWAAGLTGRSETVTGGSQSTSSPGSGETPLQGEVRRL
jgi:hypothetical protein